MQGYGLNLSCPLGCPMLVSLIHLNQTLSMYEYIRSLTGDR